MQTYPICIVPPEQHYDRCADLLEDLLRYETARSRFLAQHPEFRAPDNKFEQVKFEKGYYLLPTTSDYCILYRGQSDYYPDCLPSLLRPGPNQLPRTEDEIFIDWVRIAEFELFLKRFNITKAFLKHRFIVDFVGLAQHYGLNTHALDLTSDWRVALFFATCDFDSLTETYRPKHEDRTYLGYLYATPAFDMEIGNGLFGKSIQPIGLQPFHRPGSQKGYAKLFGPNDRLTGYLYSFNYTRADSEEIFDYFDQGKTLWSDDAVSPVARQIRKTTTFSSQAIHRAAEYWNQNHGSQRSTNYWTRRLRQQGFHIGSIQQHPWHKKLPVEDCSWEDILQNVVKRSVYTAPNHPNKTTVRETMDAVTLGHHELLNLMNAGFDAPIGYSSGLEFTESKEPAPIYGLSFSMNRLPAIPDPITRKIPSPWKANYPDGPATYPDRQSPEAQTFRLPDRLRHRSIRISP